MDDNKEMTIEGALSVLIKHAECLSDGMFPAEIKQAAAVLRHVGKPVERSHNGYRCNWCSRWFVDGYDYGDHECGRRFTMNNQKLKCTKRWTETPVLKLVIEKSEPVYVPVESEE
jgi:hypothetical protein